MARFLVIALSSAFLFSCSSMYKERAEQRDKVAQSSGVFCDFVNGDDHGDAAVELNIQMAKKCDSNKHYSITNYKNASDIFGIVYCCATAKKEAPLSPSTAKPGTPAKPAASKDDNLE